MMRRFAGSSKMTDISVKTMFGFLSLMEPAPVLRRNLQDKVVDG